jgi:glucokinase-like ROK family protein
MAHPTPFEQLRGRLIVSCQAAEGDPFSSSDAIARFAQAVLLAGAAGIRANGAEDIKAIRQLGPVPLIGIRKTLWQDGLIMITPSMEDARSLVDAGADMIALDCTRRGVESGALQRLAQVRDVLRVPVLADIATLDEARAAQDAGADAVLSTLRGYTADTRDVLAFDPSFISALVRSVSVPVIAEGRILTPHHARAALEAGAFAVVVGSAITRPKEIARRFVREMERARLEAATPRTYIGIDLGGTFTKVGLVSSAGQLLLQETRPTPAGGRDVLLAHLKDAAATWLALSHARGEAPVAIGVATAGWIDPGRGEVVYATENLPGWTGTRIGSEIEAACSLPVAVENDANALAVAEKHFGLGKGVRNFVCITLGTGVGGGCYTGGRLNHGGHFFANAIGHLPLVAGGLPCTCGLNGCLEVYANAAALVRYARNPVLNSAEAVIRAARANDEGAREAIRTLSRHLASGCAAIVQLLDPELIVLSGGLAQDNPFLPRDVECELADLVTVWGERRLRVRTSELGYHGGVLGAAAVAIERCAVSPREKPELSAEVRESPSGTARHPVMPVADRFSR